MGSLAGAARQTTAKKVFASEGLFCAFDFVSHRNFL